MTMARPLGFLLLVALAWPLSAGSFESSSETAVDPLLASALCSVSRFINGAQVGGRELRPREVVISDVTVAGREEEVIEEFVRRYHGRVIADELIDSWKTSAARGGRIPEGSCDGIAVVRLDAYSRGNGEYDWSGLAADHPGVVAVVVLTPPAIDSLQTFAVVGFELFSREGSERGAYEKFERSHHDETWSGSVGRVGAIAVTTERQARSTGRAVDPEREP
jgi:hypothetical protein